MLCIHKDAFNWSKLRWEWWLKCYKKRKIFKACHFIDTLVLLKIENLTIVFCFGLYDYSTYSHMLLWISIMRNNIPTYYRYIFTLYIKDPIIAASLYIYTMSNWQVLAAAWDSMSSRAKEHDYRNTASCDTTSTYFLVTH